MNYLHVNTQFPYSANVLKTLLFELFSSKEETLLMRPAVTVSQCMIRQFPQNTDSNGRCAAFPRSHSLLHKRS